MRFGLRALLIAVAVVAISIPGLLGLYRDATYPSLHAVNSGRPIAFEEPYIYCMAAHDPHWGRVRLVFLRRIGTEDEWKEGNPLPWLHDRGGRRHGTRIFVNDRHVVPGESVLVYYSENDGAPRIAEFNLDEIPLRDPWWPDAEKLWDKIHASTRARQDRESQ